MFQSIQSFYASKRSALIPLFLFAVLAMVVGVGRLSVQGARADEAKPSAAPLKAFETSEIRNPGRPKEQKQKAPLPSTAQLLPAGENQQVWIYPPIGLEADKDERVSTVMMLHGMCGDPLSVCDFWNRAGREGSFLLCPEGNVSCGDARDWKGTGAQKAAALDASFKALEQAYPDYVAGPGQDILIGFSRGAFVARDVAYERKGNFRGLILIGAQMLPDAKRLKESGIQKVVMAAGDFDMAAPSMRRASATMNALGLPTRYVSLGRIPHTLPANLESILRDAIQWIRQENPS